MNIVALSNRLASKVPHWHELEKLSTFFAAEIQIVTYFNYNNIINE